MSAENPYESTTIAPAAVSRRTVTLRQLDVMSVGKMLGIFYAILGLVGGAFMSLFAMIGMAAGPNGNAVGGLIFGLGAVVIVPLMYGIGGFIGGIIAALLYNGCASIVGGIKFDLE